MGVVPRLSRLGHVATFGWVVPRPSCGFHSLPLSGAWGVDVCVLAPAVFLQCLILPGRWWPWPPPVLFCGVPLFSGCALCVSGCGVVGALPKVFSGSYLLPCCGWGCSLCPLLGGRRRVCLSVPVPPLAACAPVGAVHLRLVCPRGLPLRVVCAMYMCGPRWAGRVGGGLGPGHLAGLLRHPICIRERGLAEAGAGCGPALALGSSSVSLLLRFFFFRRAPLLSAWRLKLSCGCRHSRGWFAV